MAEGGEEGVHGGVGGMEVLEFSNDWVMSCLWSKKGERCQVDIPDTVRLPMRGRPLPSSCIILLHESRNEKLP